MLYSIFALTQNETSNWLFGEKAGLNFKDTRLTLIENGAMDTPAGCSSISDRNGNLLFYTNGNSVWNSDHEIMQNGTNLAGDINNTQSSIIVPKPNDDDIYYIFTTRENATNNPLVTAGLFYSEVEFSNQNPLGAVTNKNIRLTNTITERITGIHNPESQSIKVITFGSDVSGQTSPKDTFFVFNVDENGVNKTPIKTKERTIVSSIGAMKISPNGKKIALLDNEGNFIYLYDFNINNSTISFDTIVNPNQLMDPLSVYGVEFSQDSQILYFTGNNASNTSFLYKYLIYSDNIFNAKIYLSVTRDYSFGDLQLASNGKIYIANFYPNSPITSINNISVINEPENNDEGDSEFSPLAINLRSGASYKGLPNFIVSFLRNRIITENKCVEEAFEFTTDTYMPIDSIFWEFGDGTTSTSLSPIKQYTVSGKYIVNATITYKNIAYLIQKDIDVYAKPIINSNEVLTQCDVENTGISLFNLNNIKDRVINFNKDYQYVFYPSNNDALNDSNSIINPDNYTNNTNPEELYVKIISPEGCYSISNFFIETTSNDLIDIETIYTCEDSDNISNNGIGRFDLKSKETEIKSQFNIPETSMLSFYATFEDAQTKINPLAFFHETQTTTLWMRIETEDNNCAGIGSFNAIVNSGISLNIEDAYTICYSNQDSIINLDGNQTNEAWEWRDSSDQIISTNQKISLSNPGNYSLTVYKTENNLTCSKTKKFAIKSPNPITFQEVKTENNQIFISVNGKSNYEYSIDGINYFGNNKEYTFRNVKAGIYTVYIKDIDNCEIPINQKVAFIGFPRYFTPNNDGINDFWKIEGVSEDFYINGDIYIYDRYGRSLYFMNLITNLNGWDGTFNGQRLASNDYWFKATLTDNQNNVFVKTGHFTIKY
ncbi:T9SS type B sorting domain-containing protein [Flaviramulus basaltis]|nr:T9SS type B sorting domain-containing protein [Flaviramulus basaltis]